MPSLEGKTLPQDPGIIFMGTPEFAIPSLNSLIKNGYRILAVVTQPDRPKGRGRRLTPPPVKVFAEKNSLEVLQPERASDREFLEILKSKGPDLIIVVAFGQILKKELLDIPLYGVINVHASLLPKYRGAAPIQWAIINGEKETGITIMRMDEGLDTGPILYQKAITIGEYETAGQLHDRLGELSGEFLIEALSNMKSHVIEEIPQDEDIASHAPKIDKSLSTILWERSTHEVSSLIRGLDPWPGASTLLNGEPVKLFKPKIVTSKKRNTIPGRVTNSKSSLMVDAGDGIIEILEIQFPGKRRMPVKDFLMGHRIDEGTILGKD